MLRDKLADEGSYKASICGLRLRLLELQSKDIQVKDIRAVEDRLKNGWEDYDRWLHYEGLLYLPELI